MSFRRVGDSRDRPDAVTRAKGNFRKFRYSRGKPGELAGISLAKWAVLRNSAPTSHTHT